MTRVVAIPVVAGLLVCSLILGGCVVRERLLEEEPAHAVSQQTLVEVQADVKAVEVEIATFVPESQRIEIREKPGGVISSCGAGGTSWGSSTTVVARVEPDLAQLNSDLERSWTRAADFSFELTTGSTGEPRLIIDSERLGTYIVEVYAGEADGDELRILSFSTCFAYDPERDGHPWEIAAE